MEQSKALSRIMQYLNLSRARPPSSENVSSARNPLRHLCFFCLLLACSLAWGAGSQPDDPGMAAWLAGDHEQAVEHWRDGAAKGNPQAQFLLSNAYLEGIGVEKDVSRATQLLIQSAKGGYAPAQFNVGSDFFSGEAGVRDPAFAAAWWQKAAKQGMVGAQYNLGYLYHQGVGVEQDDKMARYWFELAARGGSKPAHEMLEQLSAKEGAGSRSDNRSFDSATQRKAASASIATNAPEGD